MEGPVENTGPSVFARKFYRGYNETPTEGFIMFGRKIEMKLVKDTTPDGTPTRINIVNFDVADLESAVKKTAIVVSLAIAAQKVVTTGCKIAEIYASK